MSKRLSEEEITNIKKLYVEGKTLMDIVFETKISFWTVKYHLDEKYRNSVKSNNLNRNREIAKKKV